MSREEHEQVISQSHVIDDLCRDLASHRRGAKEARLLLTDALHALRNGAPEVTDEYVDRALSALTRLP